MPFGFPRPFLLTFCIALLGVSPSHAVPPLFTDLGINNTPRCAISTVPAQRLRLTAAGCPARNQTFEIDYVRVSQIPVGCWDADGNTTAATGGSGTWSTTTANRTWRGEQATPAGGGLPTCLGQQPL